MNQLKSGLRKFGAHVGGAGSLRGIVAKAQLIGAECVQLFASPPSNWNSPKHTEEEMADFKDLMSQANLSPNFFHAIYLLNLASDNDDLWGKSIDSLISYLTIGPKMGVAGTIFHVGSHKGAGFETVLPKVCTAINRILDNSPAESRLIIENNAGQGNLVGRDATEIARLIEGVADRDRVAVCLDTCHAFANGLDWRDSRATDDFIDEFDRLVGFDKVIAIHANDSKFDVGQNKDRHQNIGEGFIGEVGFRNILNHPKMADLPFFLETPGFTADGPDRANLDRLREYASGA